MLKSKLVPIFNLKVVKPFAMSNMITQNNKANKRYYGRSIKARDILFGEVEAPESAQELIDTLDKYAR